jgi:hypothetical protein
MKPPLDTRSIDPARVLRPSASTLHATQVATVKSLAAQLYPFPTPEFPHLRTFVNQPQATQTVFTNYGHELTPDIVVLEWPEKLVRMVGEVTTPYLLTPDNAFDVWLPESRLEGVAFYLYAPAGYVKPVKLLLRDAGIQSKDVGLRTWRRIVGLRQIDVAVIR